MERWPATIDDEGGFVLPPEVCDRLGVAPGDEVIFTLADDGLVLTAASAGGADNRRSAESREP
ncbi:MAG: AbrB/MazE/SpoVT family DNA-binding domain-containing protein [Alphaproteobacteria bacterium]